MFVLFARSIANHDALVLMDNGSLELCEAVYRDTVSLPDFWGFELVEVPESTDLFNASIDWEELVTHSLI